MVGHDSRQHGQIELIALAFAYPPGGTSKLTGRLANKQIQSDGDNREAVCLEVYCRAQGGMGIGREAAIKLAMRAPTYLGRYGDAMQPRPFGVETLGASALGAELHKWVVESVRHIWSIERPQVQTRRFDWRSQIAETAQPASPRTRVNNCTHEALTPVGAHAARPRTTTDKGSLRDGIGLDVLYYDNQNTAEL